MLAIDRAQSRKRTLPLLAAALTATAALVCCISALRSPGSNSVEPVDPSLRAEVLGGIEEFENADVEAIAIERRGEVVEIGFLLRKVIVERQEEGRTTFEAFLLNLGVHPVAQPYVTLRLFDESGAPVETVDLVGTEEILGPGQEWLLRGEYRLGRNPPRIVEETVFLKRDEATNFTLYSYNNPKESPGLLAQIARLIPIFDYEAIYTQPHADWHSFEAEFHYERVIRD